MIYVPFLASLATAISDMLERKELKKKIDIKSFQILAFLSAVLIGLPLIFFFWKLDPRALSIGNIIIFVLIIVVSVSANVLTFYSMKGEKLSRLEPAKVLGPLFIILIALIFSFFIEGAYDRNWNVVIPALISASALVVSHVKKNHLKFNRYFIAAIFGSLLFAIEIVLSKLILDFFTPINFYFFRCLFVLLLSIILFSPKISKIWKIDNKTKRWIFFIGCIWVIGRVLIYYGYLKIGIISTTLIIMLAPVFVYFFAWKFLNEKIRIKDIITSFIIVGSVVYALFL
jgi:drug/metabolite transporter (DMT)-like permease